MNIRIQVEMNNLNHQWSPVCIDSPQTPSIPCVVQLYFSLSYLNIQNFMKINGALTMRKGIFICQLMPDGMCTKTHLFSTKN